MGFTVGGYAEAKCLNVDCDKGRPGQKTTFEVLEIRRNARNGCPTAHGKCPKCGRGLMAIGKKEVV